MAADPAEERSRSGIGGPAAAGKGARQAFTVKDLQHPLPDWSLKTLVRFSSKAPFASCRDALEAPSSCGERLENLKSDLTRWLDREDPNFRALHPRDASGG
jgi:hypothetical protein